ncbi:unnamed protein product [Litomosoides sigmodontis]|uniref:Uncharacterized protein n=1 Tax=Litomosoides sigmodontis TaxID=42156 RepID=A0A3P6UZK2_LITSI|nr:unnamed protein product [Litomosoides sigmodontis]
MFTPVHCMKSMLNKIYGALSVVIASRVGVDFVKRKRTLMRAIFEMGHCWTARFVRNGATAQFLPDRSEVLVIAGPYPYTAFAFIIQKVPTLLEAAVEYIGEIFHNDQCALRKLPVPELVKVRPYNKEEICNILKDQSSAFQQQILKIFASGQIDLCLQTVSELSVEFLDFEINEIFLTCVKKEFVAMSFSTVYTYIKKWIDFLLQNTSGIRNHCLLLKQLICCTNLLQNEQLQLLLHEILPQAYLHLCSIKQYSMASVIAEVILYSIALPATYSDNCDRGVLRNVWDKLFLAEDCTRSPHFNLCTVLVMSSLDFDCTQYMQCLEKSLADFKENGDHTFSTRKQFMDLLEANLGVLLSHSQSNHSELLLNVLITSHLENNDVIFQKTLKYFRLKNILGVKISSWKIMMSEFVPASYHVLLSGKKFYQIMELLCGNGFSLKTLPVSLRVTLFSVLISLIPCISPEFFETIVESTLSIMRSDAKLFQNLINNCEERIVKKYIKILLRCGYTNNSSKSTQLLVKDLLLSNCRCDMFATKCDAVLKAVAQRSLVGDQYYFLKPLCDAFNEFHYETNAEESSKLRVVAEKVFQHVCGLVSPLDCKDIKKMSLFELYLSMVSAVKILQDNDTTVTAKETENTTEHIKISDQFCKALCKHPERVIEAGVMSEQLSQLLRRSILWMVKRGKLERIISWKYVKYFELYDETTINDVINIASVEMLRSLLHSSRDLNGSKKFALYFALAKHQNEEKRKLLCAVLEDVLKIVVDVAETNYLTALGFLQHVIPVGLFPVVTGSVYERDFVSFALTVLAVNCGLLSSDFIALRNAVSLLLNCLRFGAQSVTNDQCSLYINLFVCVGRAIHKYVDDASVVDPQFIRHLSFSFAKVASEMVKYKRSFSRVAPFIISECLEDVDYLSFALFRVFSMCDCHSIALLTTNLPLLQKTRFANLTIVMGRELLTVIFRLFCLIYVDECFAKGRCKHPEVLVRLGRNQNHSVPVCPSASASWNEKFEPKQLLQNVISCDGLLCNRCRCNVEMGYKLSNNTDRAACVLTCPKI